MSEDKEKQGKSETAKREEEILKFWQENDIFKKSVAKDAPNGEFVFYDGPPFATGLPHYGSLLSSIVKDVFPRYKSMRGFNVRRRWGWDCHGLPIENMVEKKLDLKDKTEIVNKVGIETFNRTCRESVLFYAEEWEKYVDRVGRWVEYENAYKTMDNSFMESVWWAISELYKKGLVYEGRKVLLYCPHCQTPIAKAEVAMDNSYKDVTEEAVTIKFSVKGKKDTSFLAWTTTPWTLPGNVALAVHPDVTYVEIEKEGPGAGEKIRFILAKDRMVQVFGNDGYEVVNEKKGVELVGVEYEPLFDVKGVIESNKKTYYVVSADFVTTDEGTGIVHTAVMYGEDDYELGFEHDLPMVPLLDERSHFNDKAPEFIRGKYFKQAEKDIKADLEKRGLLFAKANNTHSYPHCHRCGTALLYNAITSWFLNIQKVKAEMIKQNENINWVPEHLKYGRFLNIVENAPDWTISRNRYWASPLPIWKCTSCNQLKVIGSVKELLEQQTNLSTNLFLVRHGEAENNILDLINDDVSDPQPLTMQGKEQAKAAGQKIKAAGGVDLIVTSPFTRTMETAVAIATELGLPLDAIITDVGLSEVKTGCNGHTWKEYKANFKNIAERFTKRIGEGELVPETRKRVVDTFFAIIEKNPSKRIAIISHGLPLFLLQETLAGATEEALKLDEKKWNDRKFNSAEVRTIEYRPYPHNEKFELDLHRPYIDGFKLNCVCGEKMNRVPEVLDGWVEAASMPFAEYHYPFENKEEFESRFPGDFVSEYIAQTRTWFYYMHTIAVMLFGERPFKNIVTTGTILAEDGSKMSKSKGNYTDPLANLDLYGADAMRYYMMTSVVMQAEDLRFSDKEVQDAHNRLINILWNTVKFFDMYVGMDEVKPQIGKHVLDRWIISRLHQLIVDTTSSLEGFDTVRASRPIKDFVTDLSTWYLRRSRDRFKGEQGEEVVGTMKYVLLEFSKIIAPFIPFIAESIWQKMKNDSDVESVHLANWPTGGMVDEEVLEQMQKTRDLVTLALEARSKAGIKVRQPLSTLTLKVEIGEEYQEIIKDEVNVKKVIIDTTQTEDIVLVTEITTELKEEGVMRDLVRSIQDLRKERGLSPSDRISLVIATDEAGQKIVEKFKNEIVKTVGADSLSLAPAEGDQEFSISF